jgi:MarR family transcriptional regulator for hemolysin
MPDLSTVDRSAAEASLDYDFEESVGYWVILTAQAFQKALNDELAPHGITFRQSQVLGWLALKGDLSQVDLATRMMIEPPTLVGILDRMERDGLITRVASPTDRRCKMVHVNHNASAMWEKVVSCARKVRARAVDGLSPRQVNTLRKTLKTVLGNLSHLELDPRDNAGRVEAYGESS